MPAWAKGLVRDREFFSGNALVARGAGGQEEAWKMVYMVKAPSFYMAVCPLREVPANDKMVEGERLSEFMDSAPPLTSLSLTHRSCLSCSA